MCFQIFSQLQSKALDQNCSSQSAVWYTAGTGLGQSYDTDTIWSVAYRWWFSDRRDEGTDRGGLHDEQ